MALAWFVFAGQPLLFATYLLALALNYVYCVASTAIYRRVREIPRRRLVWDVACVILGVLLSTFEDFFSQFGGIEPSVCCHWPMNIHLQILPFAQIAEMWLGLPTDATQMLMRCINCRLHGAAGMAGGARAMDQWGSWPGG